ncbi:helix-turn-helix domain-containing protein [Paenibacillus sp. TAF43_2]|uniref:helix-turn-helix domain-containing protein n=1 Tax=Paenibacillus sp. TAF43_2 TaxID=3233069 RepID=UPI003F9A92FA
MMPHSTLTHSLYLFSSVRKRRFTGKRGIRTYRIPVYLICFITEGEGVILLDGTLCRTRPFELFLLVPGMVVEISEQSGGFEYYGVFFQPQTLVKTKGGMILSSSITLSGSLLPGRMPVSQPQHILQRIVEMDKSSKDERAKDSLSLRLQLEQFIQFLIKSVPEPTEQNDDRINRSISYMEQHYTDKISMGKLAEMAGMSPVAYSRLFVKITELSPVEYLGTIRMNKAKQLLSKKNTRVKEVAAAVGFRSEFYFSRMFQRMVGVSPTIFMKRETVRVAVASSLGYQHYLHSLGIEPVCVLDLFHYPGLSEKEYAARFHSQLEELKRSAPDLIIADHYQSEFRESLKEIAFPVFYDLSVWDWKRNFLKIAELLGRENEAAQTLTRLEMRTLEVKQTLQQALGESRITIMQVNHRTIGIQGTTGHPLNELIYGELALKPGAPGCGDIWRQEMLPESMPLLETEHLFIHKHHVLAGSGKMFQRMLETNVLDQIPAVKTGNTRLIQNWFVMSWTPIGRHSIMDMLMELCANQDGQQKRLDMA